MLKSYLRTTMTQKKLNALCILHVYANLTDDIDIKKLISEFINKNEYRVYVFRKNSLTEILLENELIIMNSDYKHTTASIIELKFKCVQDVGNHTTEHVVKLPDVIFLPTNVLQFIAIRQSRKTM
ncbi:hypothetical protein PR048_007861 [Dryococelus australis]|uniref:Uncharacterized protein n=1 Tax=Dryococelus australis TaxID=614101 RepID=A0ABQ9HVH0_9NEOP|nr:hypothetical protein PR048_007861 [Dryococelus australis]